MNLGQFQSSNQKRCARMQTAQQSSGKQQILNGTSVLKIFVYFKVAAGEICSVAFDTKNYFALKNIYCRNTTVSKEKLGKKIMS